MRFYRFVAFISGLVILAVELTAFRLIAPYFGNSIFVTTNLLGVILGALALGYWLGGRQVDKGPRPKKLFLMLIFVALILSVIPFVAPWLFEMMRGLIAGLDWTLVTLSLLATFIVFFIPFVFLGMVSPYLVRLANSELSTTGRTAGNVFAWSTLGSLLGTFVPTWLSVPLIGSKRTILIAAALLALTGALGLLKKRWVLPGALILVLVFLVNPGFSRAGDKVLAEKESSVEYLRITQKPDGTNVLQQDEGFGTHSVYHPDYVLTGLNYEWLAAATTMHFALAGDRKVQQRDENQLDIAIVGLAGGTIAHQLESFYGPAGADPHQLRVDGVELDPQTLKYAEKYFDLSKDNVPSLTSFVGDGRVWLEQQNKQYDLIILDAFRQLYVPPHLSSKEFFETVREHLKATGVAAVNLNVTDKSSLVYLKMVATLKDVFPNVIEVEVPNSFNIHFYVSENPIALEELPRINKVNELDTIMEQLSLIGSEITEQYPKSLVATDDKPLAESFFDAMLAKFILNIDDPSLYL